jgi:adenine-specific DNA-methyltransferase
MLNHITLLDSRYGRYILIFIENMYPTEKNFDMLKMIVGASSDPGDLVVDPFCGSATTMHAAESLGRRWIGIDESFSALKASIKRFRHGVHAMGDFVERKPKKPTIRSVDLFGEESDIEEAVKPKLAGHINADFKFLVDEELISLFESEIRRIASL